MMKPISLNACVAALAIASSPICFADPPVGTRSLNDMNHDLNRTWISEGGESAGIITSRSEDAAYADLIRDWNFKGSNTPTKSVASRNQDNAHADLVRDWNAKPVKEETEEGTSHARR
jgi:hypothetical protein